MPFLVGLEAVGEMRTLFAAEVNPDFLFVCMKLVLIQHKSSACSSLRSTCFSAQLFHSP